MGTVNGTKTEHRCKQCKFQSNLWTDYQWPSVKSKSVKLKPELSVQLEVVADERANLWHWEDTSTTA